MKKHIVTTYSFDELSDAAKEKAYTVNRIQTRDYCDGSEHEKTLDAFCDLFGISVKYRLDTYAHPVYSYHYTGYDVETFDGQPLRLARAIWNKYGDACTAAKYYSTPGHYDARGKYHYTARHSRITHVFGECPLTGVCWDEDILQPVENCLLYKRLYNSLDELIDACLNSFFDAWREELEYTDSMEYFAEMANANDWEFTDDGALYAAG